MNRTVLALALALATVLAGCLGPRIGAGRVDDLAPAEGVGNFTLVPDRYAVSGCDEIAGVFPVPADFADNIPKGFKVESLDPADATATLIVIGWKCKSSDVPGQNESEGDVGILGGVLVTPTAEYKSANATMHFVLVGYSTANPAIAALLKEWNVSALEPAKRTVTDFLTGAPVRSGLITLDDVTLTTQATGREAVDDGGLFRFFRADQGEVVAAFDLSWNTARALVVGRGHIEFANGLIGNVPLFFEGLGLHIWGQTYTYNITRVDFADATNAPASNATATPIAGPLARLVAEGPLVRTG
ncbi:MAG TPA: hypothetical protein VM889_07115 [Candidatus Thermoplasmatota archaeon]|nr:hypothetical protein [Candidatus Thermoplasmatota archaeon]